MKKAGASFSTIADELDKPYATVYGWLSSNKVKTAASKASASNGAGEPPKDGGWME